MKQETKFRPADIDRIIGTATPGGPTSLEDIGNMAADTIEAEATLPPGPARDAMIADAAWTVQDALDKQKEKL